MLKVGCDTDRHSVMCIVISISLLVNLHCESKKTKPCCGGLWKISTTT